MTLAQQHKIIALLRQLYQSDTEIIARDIKRIITNYTAREQTDRLTKKRDYSQRDIALITYADTIVNPTQQQSPLKTLRQFITTYNVNSYLPIIHLLPFYPWDTDRGFSITNYYQVAASNGNWNDIAKLSQHASLMFDFVANHASIQNPLVRNSLIAKHLSPDDERYQAVADYQNFVITYDVGEKLSEQDLAAVVRPRPNPLLTPYKVVLIPNNQLGVMLGQVEPNETVIGQGFVWTTFSRPQNKDGRQRTRQVDLNYSNPQVLLKVIDVLLFYLSKGADLIRLDAVAYLWKQIGRGSIHEPQTHTLLAIMNYALKAAAPGATTITEVNEAEDQYFTYLGQKNRESDMVYQFAHFPLAIHAVLTNQAQYYTTWLESTNRFQGRQFTTVLGSHDGLGLKPVLDILPHQELNRLSSILINQHHALPNYAYLAGGDKIIYEICATPWHLINQPDSKENERLRINRYLAVLSLGLLVRGIPAIYINGLLGSYNYLPPEGLDENRTINRETFLYNDLSRQLNTPTSHIRRVFDAVTKRLRIRQSEPAFSPHAPDIKKYLTTNDHQVIAIHLPADNNQHDILAITNTANQPLKISLDWPSEISVDLINQERLNQANLTALILSPYQVRWLKKIKY